MLAGLLTNLPDFLPTSGLPRAGRAYTFYVTLLDTTTSEFLIDPPVAVGDFKVSRDGGPYIDIARLPLTSPVGSSAFAIRLTAGEMDAAKVNIIASDPDDVWQDVFVALDVDQVKVLTVPQFLALKNV